MERDDSNKDPHQDRISIIEDSNDRLLIKRFSALNLLKSAKTCTSFWWNVFCYDPNLLKLLYWWLHFDVIKYDSFHRLKKNKNYFYYKNYLQIGSHRWFIYRRDNIFSMNTYHAGLFCFILACLISPDVRELCFLLAALVDRPGGVCYNNRCLDTRLRTHGHDKQLPHQHGVSCGCVYSQVFSCTHRETVLRQE